MHVLIFGLGFTGRALAHRLQSLGVPVVGTRTDATAPSARASIARGIPVVEFDGRSTSAEAARQIERATHVVLSIPPDRAADAMSAGIDPVLRCHGWDLAKAPRLRWIGYLSTVGVYGDHGGGWVDEQTNPRPTSARSRERLDIERIWLSFGQAVSKRAEVFRISGIYGPGRSAIDNLRAGTARRIVKPGQVFNRIHVDDIASTLLAAMERGSDGPHHIFNVSDDEPAPAQDVVTHAAALLGIDPPPEVQLADAGLSPMAVSFYGECKRVRNERIKSVLGVMLAYPSYREGLKAIAAGSPPGSRE